MQAILQHRSKRRQSLVATPHTLARECLARLWTEGPRPMRSRALMELPAALVLRYARRVLLPVPNRRRQLLAVCIRTGEAAGRIGGPTGRGARCPDLLKVV
jgi:hypothetical protein